MFKLLSGLISLLVYLAIGTVLLEITALAWGWQQGWITAEKIQKALRIAYGLEPEELTEILRDDSLAPRDMTYQEVRYYRSKITLDQDLRESSLGATADDFKHIDDLYSERRSRFERIRTKYEETMVRLQGAATDKSLDEVRSTIRSLKPEQAADQIVRMLELSRTTEDPKFRNDMIIILKTLPEGTQRKILAEFKTEERAPYLYDMLTQIRLGMPEVEAIRDTWDQLQRFRNRFPDSNVP
jgi:hypothetical protein